VTAAHEQPARSVRFLDVKRHLTIRSCRRRRQRTMFPDIFVAGAAHPER